MNDSITVFILADGHYNSLGLVRSIGKAGYVPKVFLIGSKDGIVRYSKFATDLTFCETVEVAIRLLISQYAVIEGKKFILTGNDKFIAALDLHREELSKNFITYNNGNQISLAYLMSKAVQTDMARRAGLNVPEYQVVKVKDRIVPNIPFPVITKAVNSIGTHWKDIVYLCHNETELKTAYDKIDCEEILIQKYVEKENETGFNGIAVNGEVYLPLQLTYRSTYETTFGNAISLFEPKDDDLVAKVKNLIKSTGYSGSFSVDLLIGKDSKIYFLEINFRNSGWSFPYTCAGANLSAIWVESMAKGMLDVSKANIAKTPFTAVDEFLELYDNSKSGMLKALGVLPRMFKADAHIYWDKNDMRPFRHLLFSTIKSHLHL